MTITELEEIIKAEAIKEGFNYVPKYLVWDIYRKYYSDLVINPELYNIYLENKWKGIDYWIKLFIEEGYEEGYDVLSYSEEELKIELLDQFSSYDLCTYKEEADIEECIVVKHIEKNLNTSRIDDDYLRHIVKENKLYNKVSVSGRNRLFPINEYQHLYL